MHFLVRIASYVQSGCLHRMMLKETSPQAAQQHVMNAIATRGGGGYAAIYGATPSIPYNPTTPSIPYNPTTLQVTGPQTEEVIGFYPHQRNSTCHIWAVCLHYIACQLTQPQWLPIPDSRYQHRVQQTRHSQTQQFPFCSATTEWLTHTHQ